MSNTEPAATNPREMTTLEYLQSYQAAGLPGAAALGRLIASMSDPDGLLQTVGNEIVGNYHEDEEPLYVLAAWIFDTVQGEPPRPLSRILELKL